ncbi:MAG: reverse transcriptase-like protein [Nitrospirota bacterium]|jgi:ribonuclease HI
MSKNLLIYASGWENRAGKAIVKIRIKDEDNLRLLRYINETIDAKDRMEAEYEAFIHGLFNAYTLQAERVRFIFDNKEVVDLFNSKRIKNKLLKPMQDQVKKLIMGFKEVKVEYLEPIEEEVALAG